MTVLGRLPALRHRDLRLLLCAQSISFVGDGMVNVALAFAVIELTGSASDLGLVLAARVVPQLAFLLLAGVVADRLSRRSVMVRADLVRLGSQGATAVLLITGLADIRSVAVLAAVSGAATAFAKPASTGLMPLVVNAGLLQQANAMSNSARALGTSLGPVIAGALVVLIGAGWALALDAISFGVSAILLAQLKVAPQARLPVRSIAEDLREGWDTFRSRTWVWALTLRDAIDNLLFSCWYVLGPFVVARSVGGAFLWGIVVGAFGIGLLTGGGLALLFEPKRPLIVVTAPAFLAVLPLACLALGLPPPTVVLAAFASGAGSMLGLTVWHTTLQRHIPPDALSRVSAYDWLGSLAVQPVGLMLWAPIAAAIGTTGALWIACALAVAATTAALALPSVRSLPAYPDRASYSLR